MDSKKIEKAIELIIEAIGEKNRKGLEQTPKRVAALYGEIFSGISRNAEDVLNSVEELHHDEMVLMKEIPLHSVCEHHLLPFFGKIHIAYIPNKNRVVGLGKILELVEVLSKRPQLQERLTTEIADLLMKKLKPLGVAVVIEARHLCVEMRGTKQAKTATITSAVRGSFRKDSATRAEFFSLIKGESQC